MKRIAKSSEPILAAFNQGIDVDSGFDLPLRNPPPKPLVPPILVDPLEKIIMTKLLWEARGGGRKVVETKAGVTREMLRASARSLRGAVPIRTHRGDIFDELRLEEFAPDRKWGVVAIGPGRFMIPRSQIESGTVRGRKPMPHGDVRKAARRLRQWIGTAADGNSSRLIRRLGKRKMSPPDRVAYDFLERVCTLHPFRCLACGKVTLDTSGKKERSYCSRQCIEDHKRPQKRESMRNLRGRQKAEKLARARRAIWSWNGRDDWKEWVADRAELTPKFLTQAVNRRDLKPPVAKRTFRELRERESRHT